jgi:DNA-binding SARP family transcriptional activator
VDGNTRRLDMLFATLVKPFAESALHLILVSRLDIERFRLKARASIPSRDSNRKANGKVRFEGQTVPMPSFASAVAKPRH